MVGQIVEFTLPSFKIKMKTRIKDISYHCCNFMNKLHGRNMRTFGTKAEFSVPAAESLSDPYFNVNK